ncbi:MAG: hypothetical protein LC664_14195 [Flavobacteriales bacterium]|nr:hypothetical protein [Flavobacteriales bacterium]
MKRIITFICLSVLISSCAFHEGIMTSSASLTDGDFRVVRFVSGSAKTVHIFGIGGLKPKALMYEAKKDMYLNFPLKEGQVYANISSDFKRSYFPFVGVTRATITADIVEFNPSEDEKKNNVFNDLRNKRETELLQQKTFVLFADTVGVWIGGELNKMEVVSNENTNSIILKGSNNTEFIYGEEQIFLLKPGIYEFTHGFDVEQSVQWKEYGQNRAGVIVGINPKWAVIKSGNDLINVKAKHLEDFKIPDEE